mmetsp:Transcript_63316/g.137766  ORF Transcript_63316/g.137766 Transcript_63316/m.137766 type:complete len:578 (-) Transcript_63316:831-2564(-)
MSELRSREPNVCLGHASHFTMQADVRTHRPLDHPKASSSRVRSKPKASFSSLLTLHVWKQRRSHQVRLCGFASHIHGVLLGLVKLHHVVDEALLCDDAHQLPLIVGHQHQGDAQASEDAVQGVGGSSRHDTHRSLLAELRDVHCSCRNRILWDVLGEAHLDLPVHHRIAAHELLEVRNERPGVNVAHHCCICRRPRERIAAMFAFLDVPEELSDGARARMDAVYTRIHDVRSTLVEAQLIGLVEMRIVADLNAVVVDANGEDVANPLGGEHGHHEGNDELQPAGELKHDDHEGNGDAADAPEDGRSSYDGVDARIHLLSEGNGVIQQPDENADNAAQGSPGVERRHKEPCWNPCAESEDHLNEAERSRDQEMTHKLHRDIRQPDVTTVRVRHAQVEHESVFVYGVIRAPVEERPDADGREHPRVAQRVARDGRDQGDHKNLEDNVTPPTERRAWSTGLADDDVVVNEEGPYATTHGAEEHEEEILGDFGWILVMCLEHRQFPCLGGIELLQGEGGNDCRKEGPDHGRVREHGAHFLQGEEHASERSSEGHRNACCCSGAEKFTLLRLVVGISREEPG